MREDGAVGGMPHTHIADAQPNSQNIRVHAEEKAQQCCIEMPVDCRCSPRFVDLARYSTEKQLSQARSAASMAPTMKVRI